MALIMVEIYLVQGHRTIKKFNLRPKLYSLWNSKSTSLPMSANTVQYHSGNVS